MRTVPLWELNRIMISLEGTGMLLMEPPQNFERFTHGEVRQGQVDLTYEEAARLIEELQTALHSCKVMDELCCTQDNTENNENAPPTTF